MKTNEHSEGKLTHLAENWFLARDVKPRRWQFFSRQDVDASQDHLDTSRPRPQPCISVGLGTWTLIALLPALPKLSSPVSLISEMAYNVWSRMLNPTLSICL